MWDHSARFEDHIIKCDYPADLAAWLRYRGRRAVDEELTEGSLDVLLDVEREREHLHGYIPTWIYPNISRHSTVQGALQVWCCVSHDSCQAYFLHLAVKSPASACIFQGKLVFHCAKSCEVHFCCDLFLHKHLSLTCFYMIRFVWSNMRQQPAPGGMKWIGELAGHLSHKRLRLR